MEIKIKKLHENAVIPRYSRNGDAALDLTATSVSFDKGLFSYGTGLAIEIPENHVGILVPRSSLSNYDLSLTNSIGILDSNFRGEILLKFRSTREFPKIFIVGERIGQLMILPIPTIDFVEVQELSETNRGSKGFGSSGR